MALVLELCHIVTLETRDFKMDLFVLLFNERVTGDYSGKMSPNGSNEDDNDYPYRYGEAKQEIGRLLLRTGVIDGRGATALPHLAARPGGSVSGDG